MSFRGRLIRLGINANGTDVEIFDGDLTINTDKKLYFRDSGCYIHSNADGYLTIEADTGLVIAAPVSITGALTYTGTLSIGTAAVGIDFTGTYTTTGIRMGTSGSPIALAAYDDHLIDIYSTCAVASNSGNAVSAFQLYSTTTGTQSEDWTMSVTSYTDIYSGNENTVGHFYSQWGTTSGIGPLGMASAVTAKMLLPTMMTGAFFPFYSKINLPTNPNIVDPSAPGNSTGFMMLSIGGETAGKNQFDDYGLFMEIHNLTAGATHLLSASSVTLKCAVPAAGTIKYLMLSKSEDSLHFEAATGVTITAGIQLARTSTGKYTDAILISGACDDNAIEITGSCTDSAIQTATGTFGTGILLGGTITTGVSIGACTTVAINITGASADGIIIGGAMSSNGVEITGVCTGAGVFLGTTNKVMFHDTGMYIRASADGHLEIVSDDTITLSSPGHGGIVFGGETDWGTGATGYLIDGSGWDWVTQTVGYVTSGALAAACAASYLALTVNATTHTTASSFFGLWSELYIVASENMTNAANVASVWGQVEMGASVATTDTADCFTAGVYANVKAGTSLDNDAAHVINGVRAQLEVATSGFSNSGRIAAFECLKKSGLENWDYGLYIADADIGINIGSCTTGITISGATTTAISITGEASGTAISVAYVAAAAAQRSAKFAIANVNPGYGDGYSANEWELSVSGTQANHVAASGSWVNVTAGTHGTGGLFTCAQTNGIYVGSGTITSALMVFGMRMIAQGTAGSHIYCFSCETSSDVLDGVFHVSDPVNNLGYTADASMTGTDLGYLPLIHDNSGKQYFVRVYEAG